MINSLLVDKSTWWALFLNSDHWLFSNPSEIPLPSGLKLCAPEIFQRIVIYVSLHKKIWLCHGLCQQLLLVISKACLQKTTLPKQLFAITIGPRREKTRNITDALTSHLKSGFSKPELGLIPPRALHPVIPTPYFPKATLETSTSSSVQKWALSHSSAITIRTFYILGLNTRKRITVRLKEYVA